MNGVAATVGPGSGSVRYVPRPAHAIYIAAPFPCLDTASTIASRLREEGHKVVSTWHDTDRGLDYARLDEDGTGKTAAEIAERDLFDLRTANVLLQLTGRAAETRGGMHVEFGFFIRAATLVGGRTMLLGPRLHAFHYLPEVEQYDRVEEVLSALRRERK